jgi:class 3 adenylate cyclase
MPRHISERYQEDDLQIQKKVATLFYIDTATFAVAALLLAVMLATGAWVVSGFCALMMAVCGLIAWLIRTRRFRLASHLFNGALWTMMFCAIKFDQYVDVYETYVLATLGLTALIITSLVSFSQWQITVLTAAVMASILGLWAIDILPLYQWRLDLLQIQNLATSILMVGLGCAAGLALARIQASTLEATRRDRDRIQRMLSMTEIYTKKSLVAIIAEGRDPTKFVPIEAKRVILFCDIRNFTTMSESMNPIDIVGFLNSFFSRMNQAIQRNGGEIDKLIGDCIMASFEDLGSAHRSAVEMQRILQCYNLERVGWKLSPIAAGIGIASGPVVIGNIGSESKLDFTSIGDVVNASSRIESLTKVYGLNILTAVPPGEGGIPESHSRFVDKVRVKGKQEAIDIHEIFGHEPEWVQDFKTSHGDAYQEAWREYHAGRFTEARRYYAALIEKAGPHHRRPELCIDPLLDCFHERCAGLERAASLDPAVAARWDGIYSF